MVKRILKKLLIIVLVLLILNNFFIVEAKAFTVDDVVKTVEGILGGIVGILSLPFRLVAVNLGEAVRWLTAQVAYTEKPTDTTIDTEILTPFDILYNKVPILDINFFEIGEEENIINQMRTGVATWYYVMRILASAILLVIFIYVGIRMAISTVASEKAMYKKMLVDWGCSLALIFVIQYIIIFTLNINSALVNAMSLTVDSKELSETIDGIQDMALKWFRLEAIGATVIFCMLVWQTIGLFIAYFNRMLKIAFLIIISPLITLTYSIDKMGDGKAQALGKWLKEFAFTILIQPFHCIIYMCLINSAFKMLNDHMALGTVGSNGRQALASALIAILCIRFVKEAEKIVRKIFAFQDDNSNTSLVAGLATSAVLLNSAKSFGKSTRKAFNGVRNIGKSGMNMARSAKVEALAVGAMIKHRNDEDKKSFSERKEEVRTQQNEKKAEKINSKYKESGKQKAELLERAKEIKKESGYTLTASQALSQARQEKIDKRKKEIQNKSGGTIGDKEAESMAKLELAKENRTRNSSARRKVAYAKGTIGKFKDTVGQSETLKELGGMVKSSVSGGAALFIGSGIYGSNGDIGTAIMSGAAVNKGMQEFMKSSSKTLIGGASKNIENLNATNPSEARKELDNIVNDKDKYAGGKEASKELDKILKDLESIMNEADKDKFESNIKSKITDAINYSPLAARTGIIDTLGNMKKEDGQSILETKQGLALLDYSDKNAVAVQMKEAEDVGISNQEFISSVVENFSTNNVYEEMRSDKVAETEVKAYFRNMKEEPEIDYENITEKGRKKINQLFDKEILKYENKLEIETNKEVNDGIINKIKEKQKEIDDKIQEALNRANSRIAQKEQEKKSTEEDT